MTQEKMARWFYLFSVCYGLLSMDSCLFDCEALVLWYETRSARGVQWKFCMAGALL